MMNRCYSSGSSGYENYGRKGVTVDIFWHSLDNFIETIDLVYAFDLEKIMNGELQLDKDIKYEGNTVYSIDNCTFVSPSENSGNRPSDVCKFVAVDSDGNISYHTNREKFCRENSLDSSTAWRMLNRKDMKSKKSIAIFYKGWQFFYQDGFDTSMIKHKRIVRGTRVGDGYSEEFTNISKFSKSYGLDSSQVGRCVRGEMLEINGWKFKIVRDKNY